MKNRHIRETQAQVLREMRKTLADLVVLTAHDDEGGVCEEYLKVRHMPKTALERLKA